MNCRLFPRPRFLFPFLLAFLLGWPAAAKPIHKEQDITDAVLANRIATKFALLLRSSQLTSFLSSRGPFTLFLPTDSAFSRLSPDEFQTLLRPENAAVLQRIVLFHIVNGSRTGAKDLLKLKTLPSCEGTPLTIHTTRTGAQLVQKAKIIRADIRCENGLIHEIDTVLLPPGLVLPTPVPPGTPEGPAPATNAPDTSAPDNSTNIPTPLPDTNAAPAPPAGTNPPSL
jgi:uncharacterized surface protein with fasciclin (FAS1) repeats